MKKKIIATLVAGAVLSSGLIGLTACGGVSLPKGEELSGESAWKTAFERTADLTNFTLESSLTLNETISGTVSNKAVDFTVKASGSGLTLMDEENESAYVEATASAELKGTVSGKEENANYTYTTKNYYESDEEDSDKVYWCASYSKSESKSSEGVSSGEIYWNAEETYYFANNSISNIPYSFYATEESTSAESIYDLYKSFTYANGVYTANLYFRIRLGDEMSSYITTDIVKCEVKVSFKDSYVIGISYKIDNASDTLYLKDSYDIRYTYTTEVVYALKNIKSTDVTTKLSKDISAAIQEAKDEREEN